MRRLLVTPVLLLLLTAYSSAAFVGHGLHALSGCEHHAAAPSAAEPGHGHHRCSHGHHHHATPDETSDNSHEPEGRSPAHSTDDCLVCQWVAQAQDLAAVVAAVETAPLANPADPQPPAVALRDRDWSQPARAPPVCA